MADDNDDEGAAYKVGYGRPPVLYRFQPGKSGNPKGRKPRSKNFQTLLENELDTPIVVKERGRERRIPKREAIVKQVVANALKGDQKAVDLLLRSQRTNPPPEHFEFDADADQHLEEYVNRHSAAKIQETVDEADPSDAEAKIAEDDVPE